MKNLFALVAISVLFSLGACVTTGKLVTDTYIQGLATDNKLTCLMSILAKVNDEDMIETDEGDFTQRLKEGIQQGLDINTMLLQYQYFKQIERDDISSCKLTLERALKRCEAVYHECDEIPYNLSMGLTAEDQNGGMPGEMLPFVTRKCPASYVRQGCCKCMRACNNYPEIFDKLNLLDKNNYCEKKNGVVSNLSMEYIEGWEPVGDKFVEPCVHGWNRVGNRLCIPGCPLGWADQGDRCIKTGTILLMPFMWQPGDEGPVA